jgi:hypothetical protein
MKTLRPNTTNLLQSRNQNDSHLMRKVTMLAVAVFSLMMMSAIASAQVSVTATAGTVGPSPYTTLKGAFDAINLGTHQGTINISIVASTTETAPAVLNASGSGAASYATISIQPSGGAARTISGAMAAGSPLIDFNGADNVTVDGLNTGGNSLTISNTTASATTGTCTIRFIGGATSNTITNSTILGSFSASVATNGGNIFFSTDAVTTNGNDNNTISNNNIGPAGAALPTKGVYSNGSTTTTAINNSGIVINNNNIFDCFGAAVTSSGVYITSGSTDINVTNNRLYLTATRTQTTGAQHSAIQISNTSGNNFQITGNTIGFATNAGTGTYTLVTVAGSVFVPIALSVGTTTATSVQNNTIAAIAMSGASSGTSSSAPFRGIYVSSGVTTIGDVTGNTIGSQSVTGSITYTSSSASASDVMGMFNFGVSNWVVNNNTVGGITASNSSTGAANVYGLRVNTASTSSTTFQNNSVGGTIANSLQSTSTVAGSQVAGLFISTSNATVTGNTIRNLSAAGGTGTTTAASVVGIAFVSTLVNHTVSQNIIHSLTNTSAAAATILTGIQYTSSTGTNLISRNFVHSFDAASATAIMNGIQVSGGTATYQNNMVRLGINAAGTSVAVGVQINGINETGGIDNFYFNSVAITGSGVTSTANTFAFRSSVTANTRNYIDNVFVNFRQTTSGVGKNYSVTVGGTAPNPAGLTSNFNVFNSPNTGGVLGLFNAIDQPTIGAWRSATGQDNSTVDSNPQFIDPSGNAASVNLHINPSVPTVVEANGLNIPSVTDDFDGQTRSSLTPVDIGADAGNFITLDLLPPTISYALLTNATGTSTRSFTGVVITDNSGVNGAPGIRPRVYYKKSTNANTFNDNTNATDGWKFVEANGGTSPFDFTINYSLIFGGVATGDTIQYFVVAQDLAATPNVAINAGTFATQPSSVALTAAAFPIGGAINNYLIGTALSGAKTVGAGGDYPTLTGANGLFATINTNVLSGNLSVSITGDLTEDGSNALNQWAEEGAGNYTLTISSDTAAVRVISGAVANGMIRLNGADRVSFDGRVGGVGQFLRFRNTNAANPTFTFQNDATANTIESCLVESANTSTTSGTIVFSTSTGTLGNSGNTIHLSDIRDRSDAAGVPANAVYSSGSVGAPNGTNTVSACNVFNWTNAGVLVTATGAGNGWIVNPSNFYQTAARTTAMTAIGILGGSGHSVLNNSIGGTAPGAGGSNLATSQTFRGIDLLVGTASPTSVQGNVIKNIRSTYPAADYAASYGIFLEAGMANIGNIAGNTVGSSNVAERYEINGDSYGIRVLSTSTVNLSNNTVNNMGTASTAPTGEFYFGISVEGIGGAHTVVNNTVTNITNNAIPDTAAGGFNTQTLGLQVTATGAQTIRGNTISNIGSTNATAPTLLNNRVWGIILSATGVGTIADRNKIDNIYASSTGLGARADNVNGVQTQSLANVTFTNNMISLTGGATSERTIFGILDLSAAPTIANYYFNSVNITGTATGANNTYAFNRNNTATVTIRDNIFANSRTGGTGFHVAMANTNAAATGWSSTASDWNLLFNSVPANITQWLGSAAGNNQTLVGFQGASGGDTNTLTGDPVFTGPSDLHIQANSPAVSAGIPFGGITVDFDNDPRPASNPDKGADEIVQAVGGVIPAGTYYNAAAANGDSLGGDVTITNQLTLNGILSTGVNTLTIDCNGTVTGAGPTVYIIGNLRKNYCTAGVKGFEVGTASGYSPVSVNATAGTFPANFTVKAVQGPQPSIDAPTALKRYWTLTEGGSLTANLNFNYLDPTDIMGNESNYHLIRVIGGIAKAFPNDCPVPAVNKACVDTINNQASINGVTEFSDWTLGEITAPTAAPATISGQVTTTSGAPLAGVTMYLGGARSGRTITDSNGNYHFAGVDTDNFYTVTPAIVNYHFSPVSRSFSLLANKTDAVFTGAVDSVITGNVIDTPEYFVRQHYLDFLGREPDASGLNFWSDQMRSCGNDFNCLQSRTINVSAAYFLSIEFQETGGLVDGLYGASYGRAPRYAEFMPDTARMAHGVIVGVPGWEQTLATNKHEFLDAWVQRADFRAAYDSLGNDGYVDALISHTGVKFTEVERNGLLEGLTSGTLSRAQVLQQVAQNERFVKAKFNEAFVRMQYFGYLRRDPDDSGFHFWVNKLNEFEGNFERADMVKSFLVSGEYRDRFRP